MKWIKRFFKVLLYLILFIIALGALWWLAATIRGDDKLDPNFEAFFHLDITGYETDNGAIALRGLEAPESEPDSYAWAIARVQNEMPKRSFMEIRRDLTNAGLKERMKVLQGISSVDWNDASNAPEATSLLEFNGKTTAISGCASAQWYNSLNTQTAQCNEADIATLAADNALMLERYKKALKHQTYIETSATALYGTRAIAMQELYMAQLVQLARRDRVQALEAWLENMEFYNRAVTGKINLIQLSILMVNRGLAQRSLPAILADDDALVQLYFPQMQQALRPIFARDVQFEYEPKLFMRLAGTFFSTLDNYNLNKFYRFEKAMLEAWKAPPQEAAAKWQTINEQWPRITFLHAADWHSPFYSVTTNLVLGGVLVGQDLTKAVDYGAVKSNLLVLYTYIIANNITPEAIPVFLSNSPSEFRNPLTGQPFQYDPQAKLLYFDRQVEGLSNALREGVLLN